MSLGVVVKGPEGIVLAADSRITISASGPVFPQPIQINFDNATKLLSFGNIHTHVVAITYGEAVIQAVPQLAVCRRRRWWVSLR